MASQYKVAIAGHVNAGKSTLFNRLISAPKAIVSPVAGTTRDRNYASCYWGGLEFQLIDTGGLIPRPKDELEKNINRQAQKALADADLILLVTDAHCGVLADDRTFAQTIKTYKKPIILVANKVDNQKWREQIAELYQLNLGEPQSISARSGVGTGDLLDEVVKQLLAQKKKLKKKIDPSQNIKVAIIGQPNVGKSSLVNALLGEERLIVSDSPHTTRDAQDVVINYQGKKITFIDTAGWRRRAKKTADPFEKQSIAMSFNSLKKADLCLLVTDVSKALSWQDKSLLQELVDAGKGIVILANKWDLIPSKNTDTINKYITYYQDFFPFVTWAPLLFTSAIDKTRLSKILPLIVDIATEKHKSIDDNALDKLLKSLVKRHKPARGKGTKQPYIYSLKQLDSNPPYFQIKIDFKSELHYSYLRFIENGLRRKFGFAGVPIKISIIKTKNVFDKK